MTAWYLAQLKPNSAALALRNLARQGFATFLPRLMRGGAPRPEPMFPGYLFVGMADGQGRWMAINNTLGVARLVKFGAEPARIPDAVMDEIRARCDGGDIFHPPEPALAPGDNVSLIDGPFADHIATVAGLDADRRVWLLLDVLGRATRLSVPSASLRPCER